VFDEFKTRAGIVDSVKDTTKKALADSAVIKRNRPDWTKEEMEMLKKISGQMAGILTDENKREFTKNDAEIRSYIKEAFMIREMGQDNDVVNRRKLLDDVQFKNALAIIENKAEYDRLLKPKTK
jgi:hypothetical protein